MTLEDVRTILPAPEGGYWFQSDDLCFVCRTDGSGKQEFKIIVKDLLDDRWSVRVDNYLDDLRFQCRPNTETLTQMYRRALEVVNLSAAFPVNEGDPVAFVEEITGLKWGLCDCGCGAWLLGENDEYLAFAKPGVWRVDKSPETTLIADEGVLEESDIETSKLRASQAVLKGLKDGTISL